MPEFRPNIMPIMFWSLAYGAAAGVLLFVLFLLSRYITVVWFPVFLAGVVWGAWRNYQQQKKQAYAQAGEAPPPQSFMAEFRQAASDIAVASQGLLNQEASGEETVETAEQAIPIETPVETTLEEPPQEQSQEPPVPGT